MSGVILTFTVSLMGPGGDPAKLRAFAEKIQEVIMEKFDEEAVDILEPGPPFKLLIGQNTVHAL